MAKGRGWLNRIDLREVVNAAVANIDGAVKERRHKLAVEPSSEPLPVDGDDVRLAQIVSNLLENAVKYTPESGLIRVAMRRDSPCAVISVADNGIGLAREELTRVFDVFARVGSSGRSQVGGLGLGLTVVRRLAALHRGSAEARSDGLGNGAEFIVRLPLAEQPALKSIAAADDNRISHHPDAPLSLRGSNAAQSKPHPVDVNGGGRRAAIIRNMSANRPRGI